jgi:SAM-dependent methyltransferase
VSSPDVVRLLRRFIPSTALLSHSAVFGVLSRGVDLIALPAWRLVTPQRLPPLRYIVRTGVGNNVLFPHYYYLTAGADLWTFILGNGYATLESTIVDIGSGIGKTALTLRDFDYLGNRFTGQYYGFDVDEEMVEWCAGAFPSDRFHFEHVDTRSSVYNPDGSPTPPALTVADGAADLVIAQSLLSHLLEDDVVHYLREARRMLSMGNRMMATVFCLDDLEEQGNIGGRWTFEHRVGAAHVENPRFPESAVAYSRAWMVDAAREAGFSQAEVLAASYHSILLCTK